MKTLTNNWRDHNRIGTRKHKKILVTPSLSCAHLHTLSSDWERRPCPSKYFDFVFVCLSTVISSIFGKSFHFLFPYFVLFILLYFPFHVVYCWGYFVKYCIIYFIQFWKIRNIANQHFDVSLDLYYCRVWMLWKLRQYLCFIGIWPSSPTAPERRWLLL